MKNDENKQNQTGFGPHFIGEKVLTLLRSLLSETFIGFCLGYQYTSSLLIAAGWKLMRLYAWFDLRNRTSPQLDAFASTDVATQQNSGVTYWPKPFLSMDYCEARNGYVCQRPAAAGIATNFNGQSSIESSVTSQKMTNVFKSYPKMISLEKLKILRLYKNCLRMQQIWPNSLRPKALKSCSKSNKLPNLVTP